MADDIARQVPMQAAHTVHYIIDNYILQLKTYSNEITNQFSI